MTLAGLSAPAFSQVPQADEAPPQAELRVGVLAYSPPWYDGAFVDESLKWLAWRLPQYAFTTEYLSPEKLRERLAARTIELAVAPAAFFAISASPLELQTLASIVSDAAADVGRSQAAAIIVRKDREDLQTLSDLRDRSIALVRDEVSPGELEVKREVLRLGADPDKFFGAERYVPRLRMRAVITEVLSGRADAGVLRACFLEDLMQSGNRSFEASIRVLDDRSGDALACRHSTPLYPGWRLEASPTLTQDAARDVAAELLTKPANAWGQHWTIATNAESYLDLLRSLQLGPFAYLREWTLSRIWDEWKAAILLATFSILGLGAHGIVLEKLVRRRTRELEHALEDQRIAEREAHEATEQLEALQRAGAVGQISSIVAHEIKQPLAVIQNLSHGTLRAIEDEPDSLDEISESVAAIHDEAGRAAAVIDRVRSWSQGHVSRQRLDASAAAADAVRKFRTSSRGRGVEIQVIRLDKCFVWMDSLELELIVINLLTNAAEAARGSPHPQVLVSLAAENGAAPDPVLQLRVEDNGPAISDEAFAGLSLRALKTSKRSGLGLGLMIVRTLTENAVGRLAFERIKPHGLAAVVTLPLCLQADDPAVQTSKETT